MNDKQFIRDVIYGLKHEYGEPVVFVTRLDEPDLKTGEVHTTDDAFTINRVILLPINIRANFMRTIGIARMGYLEPGQREILIDNSDIPPGKDIKNQKIVQIHGREEAIVKIDDYDFGTIAITKS